MSFGQHSKVVAPSISSPIFRACRDCVHYEYKEHYDPHTRCKRTLIKGEIVNKFTAVDGRPYTESKADTGIRDVNNEREPLNLAEKALAALSGFRRCGPDAHYFKPKPFRATNPVIKTHWTGRRQTVNPSMCNALVSMLDDLGHGGSTVSIDELPAACFAVRFRAFWDGTLPYIAEVVLDEMQEIDLGKIAPLLAQRKHIYVTPKD